MYIMTHICEKLTRCLCVELKCVCDDAHMYEADKVCMRGAVELKKRVCGDLHIA